MSPGVTEITNEDSTTIAWTAYPGDLEYLEC